MQNRHSGGINIGSSLILVIFVLLSLVTFATLSYMSAKSDYRLSKEAADRTASFYDANRMAELYMANVEALLENQYSLSSVETQFYEGIERTFAENDNINVVTEDNAVYLEYKVHITNGQNLQVRLRTNYRQNEAEPLFYVEKWATVVDDNWLKEVKEDSEKSGVKLLFD